MKLLSITCATILIGVATADSGLCTITPVNVGGHEYEVHKSLLTGDHSKSKLAHMLRDSNCDDPIFIDRNSDIFPHVLNHMRYEKSFLPLSGKNQNYAH